MTERAPTPGQHGGYRPGAGRKPKSEKAISQTGSDPYLVLAQAKAKRETYRAHLSELEFRRETGELYRRDEALRAITTTIAVFTEQMRALPDKLEREAGITGAQAEIAERVIDAQLEALKDKIVSAVSDG